MAEIRPKLTGLMAKLEENIDLLAGGLGVAQPLLYDHAEYGYDILENAKFKITHWKLVSPLEVLKAEFSEEQKERFGSPIWGGIGATIVAWLLRELGIGGLHPLAERALRLVQKGGVALSIGTIAGGFIWLPSSMSSSPHSPEQKGQRIAPYIYGR